MAPFSIRKMAPSWPPLKDSYRHLGGDDDDIQLIHHPDQDTATSDKSAFFATPTPRRLTFSRPKTRWWHGWRGGAKVAFAGATFVLLINVVITIVTSVAFKHMDGMSMLYIGSCTKTERINTGLHFAVNVLSTGLLAASTYCMQILSAPTREDIDKAHARGTWLDIGIVSVRNLKTLRKQKVILWWLLATSSIPLHLFYNSVFFTAIATHDYNVLYATPDFVDGAAYNRTQFPESKELNITNLQTHVQTLERLDNAACIGAYGLDFVTDRKDVIVVVKGESVVGSSVLKRTTNVTPPGGFNTHLDTFAWICDDPATPARTNSSSGTKCAKMTDALRPVADAEWRSGGYDIEYCLSEKVDADCHVHFAPQIMVPVLWFNIVKAIVITYVAFFYRDKPLVTLGDAIESFCCRPDPTTRGMCLATYDLVENHWVKGYTAQPIRYNGSRRRWYQSATWKQWLSLGIFYALALVAVFVSITVGIQNSEPKTIASAWSLGIGKVRTQNLIPGIQATSLGASAVFVSALVANAPQTVFSFIYLVYNNVFTIMVLSNEWDQFSIKSGKGKVLRVSEPKGGQKSTYFLQVPYRYAIVMLTMSGLLHWLVSQSVFLANISVIPLDGIRPLLDEITTCSYSVKAMFFVAVLMLAMLLWIGGNGFRKFSGGMPFVRSNSAAISAACHADRGMESERDGMILKPLRWGVTDFGNKKSPGLLSARSDISMLTPQSEATAERDDELYAEEWLQEERLFNVPVGHCTFTNGRVGKPVPGRLYA